jgi:flagellar hook protein FlgE
MATNGYTVMGYGTTTDTNGELVINTAELTSLDIMSDENMISPPIATTYTYGSGILDKNSKSLSTSQGQMMGVPFYDNLGYSYTAQFKIERQNGPQAEDTGQYKMTMVDITDSHGKSIFIYSSADVARGYNGGRELTAADEGKTVTVTEADHIADSSLPEAGEYVVGSGAGQVPVGKTVGRVKVSESDLGKEYKSSLEKEAVLKGAGVFVDASNNGTNSAWLAFDTYKTNPEQTPAGKLMQVKVGGDPIADRVATPQTNTVNSEEIVGLAINLGNLNDFAPGFAGMNNEQNAAVAIDLSEVQNIDNKGSTTVNGKKGHIDSDAGAGCAAGEMSSISIGQDGKITASYTNGQSKLLGQIASATFANAAGLEKTGDNLYRTTLNSGEAVINDITANGGSMSTGELEMSNVDLSAEFTDMITTQRGFQANSRIITVSDSMLEELVNLKR